MSRALRIIQLIESELKAQEPQEPDPAGDKERKKADQGYSLRPPKKAKKVFSLDGSYEEEPGFYISCPKCGEVGSTREPKGDITDTLCKHCEEPLVPMGSLGPTPADQKVVDAGKARAKRATEKAKKAKTKGKNTNNAKKKS